MLKLDQVTKRFRGGVTAVDDLSLELGAGVVGLLGPNGAGKTTLMQLIATITRPTQGQIHFQGVDILRGAGGPAPRSSATCRRTSASTTTSPRSSSSATSAGSRASRRRAASTSCSNW